MALSTGDTRAAAPATPMNQVEGSPPDTGPDAGTDGGTASGAGPRKRRWFRLTTRDYINVGIFTALYFVLFFATGMIGIINPLMMFAGWAIGLILNGIVIALFMARTPKMGAMTLLSPLLGVLWVLVGHPVYLIAAMLAIGFACDLILDRFRGRPSVGVPLAYAVFSLWVLVPMLPLILNADEYYARVTDEMGPGYAADMRALIQPWLIGAWGIVVLVLAWLGGMLGVRVGKRHFARAGLA